MATYVLFGRYPTETLKEVTAKRTAEALAVVKKFGGEYKAGYALLGDPDLVVILECPDNERALQTSVALTKLLGIPFRTAPAVTMGEFDKLMATT